MHHFRTSLTLTLLLSACGPVESTSGLSEGIDAQSETPTPDPTGTGTQTPQPTPTPRAVSFQNDVRPVLEQHCVACHKYGGQPLNLKDNPYDSLMSKQTWCAPGTNVPTVTPDDPEASPLWIKIANVSFDCGREMPPLGTGGLIAIAPDQAQLIYDWIAQGAQDN